MKRLFMVLPVLLCMLTGCGSTRDTDSPTAQPELIWMSFLPPQVSVSSAGKMKLNVLFHLRNDGRVAEARILGTSGDSSWDQAAIDSMTHWRFTAARDNSAADRWIRYTLMVQEEQPLMMSLGELVAPNKQDADSLYSLLKLGAVFDSLALQSKPGSGAQPGRLLGSVDIANYPQHVREELRKLKIDEFTRPIRVGTSYVIYKRFDTGNARSLPQ